MKKTAIFRLLSAGQNQRKLWLNSGRRIGSIIAGNLITVVFAIALTTTQVAAQTYLPVPEGAKGPLHPLHLSGTLYVEEINNGLYFVTDGISQTMFKVGSDGVLLVDAPLNLLHPAIGNGLLGVISEMGAGLPITHLIYSHRHRDHIGGAPEIKQAFPGVKIFAHQRVKEALQSMDSVAHPTDPLPLPQVVVQEGHELKIQPFDIRLVATQGYWHTPGDLMIYAPEEKVLMAVDMVDPGWVPFTGFNFTSYLPGYAQALQQALAFDFDHYIGGHGRLGGRVDIENIRDYTKDVRDAVAQALQVHSIIEPGTPVAVHDNIWNLFKLYIEAVVDDCVGIVVDKYLYLGAVDSFTASHCRAAITSSFND